MFIFLFMYSSVAEKECRFFLDLHCLITTVVSQCVGLMISSGGGGSNGGGGGNNNNDNIISDEKQEELEQSIGDFVIFQNGLSKPATHAEHISEKSLLLWPGVAVCVCLSVCLSAVLSVRCNCALP